MTTVTKTEGNALRRETEGGNDRRPKTQSDSNTGKLEKWKEEDKVGVRIGEKEAAPTHRTVHPVALQVQRGGVRDPLSLEEEREPPHSQETAHTNHLFRPNHDNQEKNCQVRGRNTSQNTTLYTNKSLLDSMWTATAAVLWVGCVLKTLWKVI